MYQFNLYNSFYKYVVKCIEDSPVNITCIGTNVPIQVDNWEHMQLHIKLDGFTFWQAIAFLTLCSIVCQTIICEPDHAEVKIWDNSHFL